MLYLYPFQTAMVCAKQINVIDNNLKSPLCLYLYVFLLYPGEPRSETLFFRGAQGTTNTLLSRIEMLPTPSHHFFAKLTTWTHAKLRSGLAFAFSV